MLERDTDLRWTHALPAGYRPAPEPFFSAVLHLEARRKNHDEMGFHHGWGAALDQLVAMTKGD